MAFPTHMAKGTIVGILDNYLVVTGCATRTDATQAWGNHAADLTAWTISTGTTTVSDSNGATILTWNGCVLGYTFTYRLIIVSGD